MNHADVSDAEAEFWEIHYNLCPDTATHDRSECESYGCPNFADEMADLAPWGTAGQPLREWT